MRRRLGATLQHQVATVKRESKYVEFKERFDTKLDGAWCELLKDFAALANSGGGLIVIGVKDNGEPSSFDVRPVLAIDPATISDKLFRYSGLNDLRFDLHEARRGGKKVAAIEIERASIPVVFTRPGTYLDTTTNKQKTAFSQGTVYFRHGAKSEPGTSADLRAFIDQAMATTRKEWLKNLRKVVNAPPGAHFAVVTSLDKEVDPTRIQITNDPNAPVYGKLNPDQSHPYRQKEVVQQVNQRMAGKLQINGYDVQCVRNVESIDEKSSPQFCHRPLFGWTQYSDLFVGWLIEMYRKDANFFINARDRYKKQAAQRGAK